MYWIILIFYCIINMDYIWTFIIVLCNKLKVHSQSKKIRQAVDEGRILSFLHLFDYFSILICIVGIAKCSTQPNWDLIIWIFRDGISREVIVDRQFLLVIEYEYLRAAPQFPELGQILWKLNLVKHSHSEPFLSVILIVCEHSSLYKTEQGEVRRSSKWGKKIFQQGSKNIILHLDSITFC